MNYYNPYFYNMPLDISYGIPKTSLFSRIFKDFSFGKVIDGTQKVLNFANQAIPLAKQIKPMIGNAKTMFKVMNEFKRVEYPRLKKENNVNKSSNNYTNGPTFFA